ncbi:protein tyrosine phosphatase domain-containing protein 1-like isoform X2 [Artemia franciscana]|uniref:protein tyrosine phosphatase domain-containing protein 1-like isoform X2 n=1 Tax=Artemia franciscana TaxID=6661 RepID=UPI0032D9D36D
MTKDMELILPGFNQARKSENFKPGYSKFSENLRQSAPNDFLCKMFCGGKECKYENPKIWKTEDKAMENLYSHWITDDILAMVRPTTEHIKQGLMNSLERVGIKTIINLQEPGEHAFCGPGILDGDFTYRPEHFMEKQIFYYNFAWKDYSEATMEGLLDILKVMSFALEQGKIAVHCHAGLGRTGVLISSYLVFALRVTANDAIAYVRSKRPGSLQTRSQILCVQSLDHFLQPASQIFSTKSKNQTGRGFTLQEAIERQNLVLHGEEARNLRYIPKVIFIICERLCQLCNIETSQPNFTRTYISAEHENIKYESLFDTHQTKTTLDRSDTRLLLSDTLHPLKSPCNSFENGEDNTDENKLEEDLSSKKKSVEKELCIVKEQKNFDIRYISAIGVIRAFLSIRTNGRGSEAILSYIKSLDGKASSWRKLETENNAKLLACLLISWFEGLRSPMLGTNELSYIIAFGANPARCIKQFDKMDQLPKLEMERLQSSLNLSSLVQKNAHKFTDQLNIYCIYTV